MNSKLTEKEYQHMIISLISQSIRDYGKLEDDSKEGFEAWIYFMERLKIKGILADLNDVQTDINPKSRQTARNIKLKFENDNDTMITTMI